MSEWWTYRPSDFLLFSPRVYERLIESHNGGLWPWHVVAAALGVCVLVLALKGGDKAGKAGVALVGAGLIVAGWSFLWSRYAAINWAAGLFAPAFWIAGAAFVAIGALMRAPLGEREARRGGTAAVALVALSLGYLLVAPAFGRGWGAAEVAGLMPDPTALMALGLAALVRRPVAAAALAIVPLAWSLYAAMTLWTLGAPQAFAMTSGLALFAVAAAVRSFADRRPGEPETPRPT